MSKFKVRKHQDAYAVYETVVEADSAEAAGTIAGARGYDGSWHKSHVMEFDDYDMFPEEIEAVADEFTLDDLEEFVEVQFTPRERDGVLAALRLWQKAPEDTRAYLSDIFTNSKAHDGLSDEEIDDLCERINA